MRNNQVHRCYGADILPRGNCCCLYVPSTTPVRYSGLHYTGDFAVPLNEREKVGNDLE
ncbi:mCG1038513 [Mus musculus]|nr:mCG1038513 [Mus musculus]